jgi:hypothetical protein
MKAIWSNPNFIIGVGDRFARRKEFRRCARSASRNLHALSDFA